MNDDSDYLMLSGIKQYCFCKRRWALIYVEQQWQENALTLDGHYMHERVHDAAASEKRGGLILARGMAVQSHQLRISGICDMWNSSRTMCTAFRFMAEAGHTVYIPWNTSVGGRMRAGRMNGNFARRQCAWKRCCARKSRKARFITANCAAGKALCLPGK